MYMLVLYKCCSENYFPNVGFFAIFLDIVNLLRSKLLNSTANL